jgi:hypothetical protein
MTNLEAIKYLIGSNADLSDERLTLAAEFVGINPDDDFDQSNRCQVFGLVISEILENRGVKRFSEGDYSVEYTDQLATAVKAIAKKSGCADLIAEYAPDPVKPVIRNASNRW